MQWPITAIVHIQGHCTHIDWQSFKIHFSHTVYHQLLCWWRNKRKSWKFLTWSPQYIMIQGQTQHTPSFFSGPPQKLPLSPAVSLDIATCNTQPPLQHQQRCRNLTVLHDFMWGVELEIITLSDCHLLSDYLLWNNIHMLSYPHCTLTMSQGIAGDHPWPLTPAVPMVLPSLESFTSQNILSQHIPKHTCCFRFSSSAVCYFQS